MTNYLLTGLLLVLATLVKWLLYSGILVGFIILIIACLDALDLEVLVIGLEAGTLAQYLTYGLQSVGYEVVCMEARQVKAALSAMRNKTDKHDARGIAQLLRTGWYSPVHIKSM